MTNECESIGVHVATPEASPSVNAPELLTDGVPRADGGDRWRLPVFLLLATASTFLGWRALDLVLSVGEGGVERHFFPSGAWLLVAILGGLAGGHLADRVGAKRVLCASALGWPLVTISVQLVSEGWAVTALGLAFAFWNAVWAPAAFVFIRDWALPSQRGRAFALLAMAPSLGSSLLTVALFSGSMVFGRDRGQSLAWRLLRYFFSFRELPDVVWRNLVLLGAPVLALGSMLLLSRVQTPTRLERDGASRGEIVEFLRRRWRLLMPLTVFVCASSVNTAISPLIDVLLRRRHLFLDRTEAWLWLPMLTVVGCFISGILLDRIGKDRARSAGVLGATGLLVAGGARLLEVSLPDSAFLFAFDALSSLAWGAAWAVPFDVLLCGAASSGTAGKLYALVAIGSAFGRGLVGPVLDVLPSVEPTAPIVIAMVFGVAILALVWLSVESRVWRRQADAIS